MRLRPFLRAAGLLTVLALGAIATVSQPFVTAVASQSPTVDAERLKAHVRHLSVDLFPRSYDHKRRLDQAAAYIRNEFAASGGTVSTQEVRVEGETFQNIVVRYGPQTGSSLVIGAHYDSYGDASEGAKHARGYSLETHTPGADDNASGVAGLIELAKLLGRNAPKHPVELVAYTLEEPPNFRTENMGSAWHARSIHATGRNVQLVLVLEMIGYFSDTPDSQEYPLPGMAALYSDRGNFAALVGRLGDFSAMRRAKALMTGATDLPVYSINAPPLIQGIDFSDHLNYWNADLPAIMVTDTAFLRNSNYHQSEDTFEKLDYVRMAKVVEGVYAIAQNF